MSKSVNNSKSLNLDDLHMGIPVISKRGAGLLIECCMYCMHTRGHKTNVRLDLKVLGAKGACAVCWNDTVTRTWSYRYDGNETKTTEHGATAIALMVIKEYTDYTAVREAYKGTRVDYVLSRKDFDEDTFIFDQADAYVEIRGIRKETKGNTIVSAARKKLQRLNKAVGIDKDLPCYVAVVEFGQPHTRIVQK